jgi:hypothetical protein
MGLLDKDGRAAEGNRSLWWAWLFLLVAGYQKNSFLTVGGPMAREIGTWWIKDGIDGRRIEATGFW